MNKLLLLTSALLILGCSDQEQKSTTPTPSKPAPQVTASEPNATVTPAAKEVSGKLLFAQRCSSCHGSNAEKKAMNASLVIAGWKKDKVLDALKGYLDGSYGGKMKSIMKSQSSLLDEKEKVALAEYIETINQ